MHAHVASFARAAWRVATSLGTSCVLLALLGLLTWLGTLAQVELGLYEAQRTYFESYVLVQRVGPLPIPLPGGNLVLCALFVNLVCGGIVRMRRAFATLGVLVAHVGVALLLIGSFVKLHGSVDGHVTLYEGESADWFESYQRWELVVRERGAAMSSAREHVLREDDFRDASGERVQRIRSAELPFELELSRFARHSRLVSGIGGDAQPRLVEEAPRRDAESNIAGLCATLVAASDDARRDGVLWGAASAPWRVQVGARSFELELRHERYPLPFTLALRDFEKEDHPGTALPKSFASAVTVRTDSGERALRISMNEPLREGGVVVYQASWGPQGAGPGARLFSTLAVARNPADRIPLAACVIIAVGLVLHFTRKLVVHLRSQRVRRRALAPRLELLPRVAAGFAPWLVAPLALGLASSAFGAPASAQAAQRAPAARVWSPRALELAAELPLQEGGRIKPLSTYASTLLLRFNGRRAYRDAAGDEVEATAWLLELLCFPNDAAQQPVLLVQNPEVLDAIGVAHAGKRARDRYSFEELRPGLERLMALAHEYDALDERERSAVQAQLVNLAENALVFGRLAGALEFARLDEPRFEDYLGAPMARPELAERYLATAYDSDAFAIFPPLADAQSEPQWSSPLALARRALGGAALAGEHAAALAHLAELARVAADPAAFERELAALRATCDALAAARGEARRVGLEAAYYRLDPLHWSLCLFGGAFVLLALTWLWPSSRALYGATIATALAACAFVALAIALRCVIRGRPPVSTLYETVLFVTASGALGALVVEWIARARVALGASVVLGLVGLFVANGYEALDARDTMPSLVAVLDTNFWLATHVTAITIGYSAGMLAALLGSWYVLGKLARALRRGAHATSAARAVSEAAVRRDRDVARMVYGVLCFGVIFTTIGTILGGIWANESWGRFWGWDPKENGALLIVISQLVILHARRGGYLREHGLCVAAALGGSVVAFSWWGVNLLGVGLHSYGFTSGIQRALWSYYALQWTLVLFGFFVAWRERGSRTPRARTEESR